MDVLNTRQCIPFFLFAVLLGIATNSHGEDTAKTAVASLVAGPQVCIREQGKTLCEMEAALIWEVPESGGYCLWDEGREEPIQCWSEAVSGTVKLTFSGDTNRTFRLTRSEQRVVLATATIKVMGALEQRLRARRRNRFWRVF